MRGRRRVVVTARLKTVHRTPPADTRSSTTHAAKVAVNIATESQIAACSLVADMLPAVKTADDFSRYSSHNTSMQTRASRLGQSTHMAGLIRQLTGSKKKLVADDGPTEQEISAALKKQEAKEEARYSCRSERCPDSRLSHACRTWPASPRSRRILAPAYPMRAGRCHRHAGRHARLKGTKGAGIPGESCGLRAGSDPR